MVTRFQLLRRIWVDHINALMDGEWIDTDIESWETDPDSALTLAGQALKRLLAQGASREDLCHVARSVAFWAAEGTLRLLDDPGVDDNDLEELANGLYEAAPRGFDGRVATWPLAPPDSPTKKPAVGKASKPKSAALKRKRSSKKRPKPD